MPFLPPNQQLQSTEGKKKNKKKGKRPQSNYREPLSLDNAAKNHRDVADIRARMQLGL